MAKYVRPKKDQPAKLNAVTLSSIAQNTIGTNLYSLKEDGISQSLMTNWTCRWKFLMSINRWTTPGREKISYYGTMCHHVLEQIYKLKSKRMPDGKRIRLWVADHVDKNRKKLRVATDNKIELAAGMVEHVMTAYCKYYSDDLVNLSFLKVEGKFAVPYKDSESNPVILRGMQDGLFKYNGKNGIWMLENKSMGTVKEDMLLRRLPIDKQNLFYVTAEEEQTDHSLAGVLFNIIRRPQIKYKDDITEFLHRLKCDLDDRPEFYFIRFPVTYSQTDKTRFKVQLKDKLLDIQRFLDGKTPLYRNEDACESSNNGAPYVCQFIDACGCGNMRGYIQQKSLFPELED